MDATAAGATARGVALPMPSSTSSRKEWRAVHHQTRCAAVEELERSKLGQADERTIHEVQQGREPVDVDFCSITIDGNLNNDILQQRLHTIATQREELQQMEIELRAQIVARSEIIGMQNNFDAQLKEHANATSRLQEQLHERELAIHELERRMEEKDRELHAIKLDNEAAWAKEDLLREQNKELATFRRERDHSEVERAQHIKQLHELQEHIQEKERLLIELQEQHRVSQETILFKDDQLREAQAWIARVQEMDALQSNSLQAELRDRTEQYNQLWLAWQRQFAEMERHHVHIVQQLQLELADVKERNGTYTEESRVEQTSSKNAYQFRHNNGDQLDVNGGVTSSGSSGVLSNGNSDSVPSYASTGYPLTQSELVAGVPLAPSSLLGVPAYLPPGQVPALHPFVMHQQGVPHSVPSHVPQSHVGHFQSIPEVSSVQQWQNQQTVPERSHLSSQNQMLPVHTDQNVLRSDGKYDYERSVNGQAFHSDYLDSHNSQGVGPDSMTPSSTGEPQVLESIDRSYLLAPKSEQNLLKISSQLHDALRLNSHEQNNETKLVQEYENPIVSNHVQEGGQGLTVEQPSSAANTSLPNTSPYSVSHSETTAKKASAATFPESHVSTGLTNLLVGVRASETTLLDERSLLACVVRTIPAGGKTRISSTLPNRLGKMLAPLHWHDYRKRHGKLEDFVAGHPELFVIDGDYIQLREGAQEIIAATAAVAKVAAAAAASTPYSSFSPSVAVTPMAQSRLRKVPSIDSKHVKTDTSSHLSSELQNQHTNGVRSASNFKKLGKSNEHLEQNGLETGSGQFMTAGNGANFDRSSFSSTEIKGSTNGRPILNYVRKQPSRTTGAASISRR